MNDRRREGPILGILSSAVCQMAKQIFPCVMRRRIQSEKKENKDSRGKLDFFRGETAWKIGHQGGISQQCWCNECHGTTGGLTMG